jgi:hypothetical protein
MWHLGEVRRRQKELGRPEMKMINEDTVDADSLYAQHEWDQTHKELTAMLEDQVYATREYQLFNDHVGNAPL